MAHYTINCRALDEAWRRFSCLSSPLSTNLFIATRRTTVGHLKEYVVYQTQTGRIELHNYILNGTLQCKPSNGPAVVVQSESELNTIHNSSEYVKVHNWCTTLNSNLILFLFKYVLDMAFTAGLKYRHTGLNSTATADKIEQRFGQKLITRNVLFYFNDSLCIYNTVVWFIIKIIFVSGSCYTPIVRWRGFMTLATHPRDWFCTTLPTGMMMLVHFKRVNYVTAHFFDFMPQGMRTIIYFSSLF